MQNKQTDTVLLIIQNNLKSKMQMIQKQAHTVHIFTYLYNLFFVYIC